MDTIINSQTSTGVKTISKGKSLIETRNAFLNPDNKADKPVVMKYDCVK